MGTIEFFPSRHPSAPPFPEDDVPAVPPAAASTGGRGGQYGLADLIRMLGLGGKSIRTAVETMRVLVGLGNMPLPITPRIVNGQLVQGARSIHQDSRWDAGRFDFWLEHRGMPEDAPPAPVPQPVRDAMAARAARLGMGNAA
jgi:hypothetical protein